MVDEAEEECFDCFDDSDILEDKSIGHVFSVLFVLIAVEYHLNLENFNCLSNYEQLLFSYPDKIVYSIRLPEQLRHKKLQYTTPQLWWEVYPHYFWYSDSLNLQFHYYGCCYLQLNCYFNRFDYFRFLKDGFISLFGPHCRKKKGS